MVAAGGISLVLTWNCCVIGTHFVGNWVSRIETAVEFAQKNLDLHGKSGMLLMVTVVLTMLELTTRRIWERATASKVISHMAFILV